MPNIRSAIKRVRADAKRRDRNLDRKSELKTLVRKFRELVQAGKKDEAKAFYPTVARGLDQAAGRKALHKNTASRKKSRLARQLASIK